MIELALRLFQRFVAAVRVMAFSPLLLTDADACEEKDQAEQASQMWDSLQFRNRIIDVSVAERTDGIE